MGRIGDIAIFGKGIGIGPISPNMPISRIGVYRSTNNRNDKTTNMTIDVNHGELLSGIEDMPTDWIMLELERSRHCSEEYSKLIESELWRRESGGETEAIDSELSRAIVTDEMTVDIVYEYNLNRDNGELQ